MRAQDLSRLFRCVSRYHEDRRSRASVLNAAPIPVIAIDGPAASGKGTVAAGVAKTLRFHLLDSGSLYRLVALNALESGTSVDAEQDLARLATGLDVVFEAGAIRMDGRDVIEAIRGEAVSAAASRVAVHPAVRMALIDRQRAFRQSPGLVADGRDMGTVVFPDALLKVFLSASPEERARRRHKQLIEKGISVTLDSLLRDIRDRDARDAGRAAAPLRPADDAVILETTEMTIAAAIRFVLETYRAKTAASRE